MLLCCELCRAMKLSGKLSIAAFFLFLVVLSLSGSGQNRSTSRRLLSPKIENIGGLANFFKALRDVSSRRRIEPVRVMHFGDSHVAADVLTADIRRNLQAEFGDGGAGYIVPNNPMNTRRRGVVSGATSGWQVEGIGGRIEHDGIYGLAGIALATSLANERIWLEASANHFEIYYVHEPRGGKINVTIDGADVLDAPLSLDSPRTTTECLTVDNPADTTHRLEIHTLTTGKARVLGIVAERLVPGVSYDVLGINGARLSRIRGWNRTAFAASIRQRKPDLIVLAYGTNEVTDAGWTPSSYERLLRTTIKQLREAAPEAAILIFAPPDRADLPIALNRMPALIEAERSAALKSNCAFWSASDAMGGLGSMNTWVSRGLGQADKVHLTRQGYVRLGDAFFQELMRAYQRSLPAARVSPR